MDRGGIHSGGFLRAGSEPHHVNAGPGGRRPARWMAQMDCPNGRIVIECNDARPVFLWPMAPQDQPSNSGILMPSNWMRTIGRFLPRSHGFVDRLSCKIIKIIIEVSLS
jgi:hypothetical protein